MNIISLSLNGLKRDWRSGELRLIAFAITIAVASVTSVSFFTDRVQRATESQATELLAADLVLRSSEPIKEALIEQARSSGLITTRTTSFRSVVVANDILQMSEVKAVEEGYPLRGILRISETLFGKEKETTGLPASGTAWVDNRLLQNLRIDIGSQIIEG